MEPIDDSIQFDSIRFDLIHSQFQFEMLYISSST